MKYPSSGHLYHFLWLPYSMHFIKVLHWLLSVSTFEGSAYLGAALPLTSPFVIKMVLRHLSFPFFVCKLLVNETVLFCHYFGTLTFMKVFFTLCFACSLNAGFFR